MPEASVQIVGNESQPPIYVNAAELNAVAGNLFLNLGYVDPSAIALALENRDNNDNVVILKASSLVKIVMSPMTAQQLFDILRKALIISDEEKNENQQ